MRIRTVWTLTFLLVGCGGGKGSSTGLDGSTGGDGSTTGPDGGTSALDGSTSGPDGAPLGDGGWGALPDGGCMPVMCQEHLYACGNCEDDDGDGLADWADPDCLGPCDNNEAGFDLMIPGGDAQPCALDCYFDQDEGFGNDGCRWDHRCDPLRPDPLPLCQQSPPPNVMCSAWSAEQSDQCDTVCGPLTPNGCDCFGCCNLPAGGDQWVFIGSTDGSGTPTCNLDSLDDPGACRACTPVPGCLNDCGPCELCLGRTTLPPECTPGEDGGVPPGDRCEAGVQACGLPGDAPCPAEYFCLTGCCQFFG